MIIESSYALVMGMSHSNVVKVCVGMKNVFIKDAQSSFHKTITWVKNSVEGI